MKNNEIFKYCNNGLKTRSREENDLNSTDESEK